MLASHKKLKTWHGTQQVDHRTWEPDQVKAKPISYLVSIPNELKCEPQFATAALLGLSEASLELFMKSAELVDVRKDKYPPRDTKQEIVQSIEKFCPGVLKDGQVFRKLLKEADETTINLLLYGRPSLIDAVTWDENLARWAVQKAPLCYLRLPTDLKTVKELVPIVREKLCSADDVFIEFLIRSGPMTWSTLIDRGIWNRNVALQAVTRTPLFYKYLPAKLKEIRELAMAAVLSPNADEDTISHVRMDNRSLFDESTALQEMIVNGGEKLIRTLLIEYCNRIVWNEAMVGAACSRFPVSYHFLPAMFREDHIDAQRVMGSLLPLMYDSGLATAVDEVIAAVPGFFANQHDLKQLFFMTNAKVLQRVVMRTASSIPWDRQLIRLVAQVCLEEYEYSQHNPVHVKIMKIYKEESDCADHLPLGVLLHGVFADSVEVWPDWFYACVLVRDDAVLIEALESAEHILKVVDLASDLASWLGVLVHRVKNKCQNNVSFHSLVTCIAGARDGAPLECLKGKDETRVAFKRNIAAFLGATVSKTEKGILRNDASKLIHCLLTMPEELRFRGRSDVHLYRPRNNWDYDEPFYCNWCCKALTRLDKIYNSEIGDDAADNDERSEESVDDSTEIIDEAWEDEDGNTF
jgi:hypothetical protein